MADIPRAVRELLGVLPDSGGLHASGMTVAEIEQSGYSRYYLMQAVGLGLARESGFPGSSETKRTGKRYVRTDEGRLAIGL